MILGEAPIVTKVEKKAIAQQKAILELAGALASKIELRPLLSDIISRTRETINADRSTIFLHDDVRGELWSLIAEGERSEIRMPDDKGLAGKAFQSGKPLIIHDCYSDPRHNREVDKRTGYVSRNMLCFPFTDRLGKKIGVLQLLNKMDGDFGDEDLEFLQGISSLVAVAIENAMLYERRKEMFDSMVATLAETIDMRDPLTAGHSRNVMDLAVGAAKKLGLNELQIEILRYAALLHDYGKVGVPDAVLLKPGKLTPDEYEIVKKHANLTREILQHISFESHLREIPFIAGAHHERMDGSGYPDGIVGDRIPLLARLIAVSDVYEALTSKRYYRDPVPPQEALEYLCTNPNQFDQTAVQALIAYLEDGGQ
jgi:HD-GYP domain-containing protein (c-di-GMP phosphodiesterase class II)